MKKKYYLWAWKSRSMSLKKNEMQITENHLFATHNLEVPGSSPGWSTLRIKHLREIASAFSFIGNLQVTFLRRNSVIMAFCNSMKLQRVFIDF